MQKAGSSEVSLPKVPIGMPHINAAAALQISMLLFALPAQYFISQWYGTDSAERIQITGRLIIASWSISTRSYLSLDAWADRLKLWLSKTRNWYYGENKAKRGANEDLKDTPHYRILINKANGFGKSTAYVSEEEITVITGLESL
ncbi:hypothetical protein EK904_013811 [Melospiza melodia maxima]|nr:hypothetical protein EK904_013811 [Melospiza melodia maxima]